MWLSSTSMVVALDTKQAPSSHERRSVEAQHLVRLKYRQRKQEPCWPHEEGRGETNARVRGRV